MSATKSAQDAKKEEFRKYLDKGGVIDLLTKGLVALYEEPEKPSDAVTFLKTSMGAGVEEKAQIEELKKENNELKEKVEQLQKSIGELEEKVKEGGDAPATEAAPVEASPVVESTEEKVEEPVEKSEEAAATMETENKTTEEEAPAPVPAPAEEEKKEETTEMETEDSAAKTLDAVE